jgi:hypothetical protein
MEGVQRFSGRQALEGRLGFPRVMPSALTSVVQSVQIFNNLDDPPNVRVTGLDQRKELPDFGLLLE